MFERARLLPHPWKSMLFSGAIAVVLGILALAWPGITIAAAANVVGAYLLLSGTTQVVFGFSPDRAAGGRFLLVSSGAASMILAMLAFGHFRGTAVLANSIGVGLLLLGMATTLSTISDPACPGRGWNTLLGAVSIIAGIAVLGSRTESLVRMTVIVGIWLLVTGVCEVATALGIRRAYSRQRLGAVFGDIRMLCQDVGLMTPLARLIWRICKIDGPPSRYRSEPQRTPLPTPVTDHA
jgi:uncharacterized membrane protein HdeD (DUF308 family)